MQSSPIPARLRLDTLLASLGYFPSRSRARDAIERGAVRVDGVVARKAGDQVLTSALVEIDDPAIQYVSRAALKLVTGLDHFSFDPSGRAGLDIGASTGGFTQVLLERGATNVIAIDVGHGQLHESLSSDPRVRLVEGLNARELTVDHLGGVLPEFAVCDVSFISLKLAIPQALALCGAGAFAVLLVKPQFEVGREGIGKGGIVKDATQGPAIAAELMLWLDMQPGWRAFEPVPSPIAGGDGNHEFLLGGVKDR